MKLKSLFILVLTILCLNIYSQTNNENRIKSIGLMDANDFGVSLYSKDAGELINNHLNIPKGYEFRNQIVGGNEYQTIDDYGFVHERYDQYYNGIKVEHSDVRTHYLNDKLVLINGEYIDSPFIDIRVVISKEAAIQKAMDYIGAKKYIWEDERECELITSNTKNSQSYCFPNPEIVICRDNFAPEDTLFYISYKVNIRALDPFSDDYVYVDAKTGKVLNTVSQIHSVNGSASTRYSGTQNISTQQNGSSYRLKGYDNNRSIETYNLQKGTSISNVDFTDNDNDWKAVEFHNSNKDDAALDVHWGAMVTWDYFKQTFGWNSFNGSGATIKNYIHFGHGVPNANWDNKLEVFYYGDGDENEGEDPYVSLDIVAHEIAHGFNKYTSKLNTTGEAGAIGEGISDIWGIVVSNYANNQFSGLNKNIWLHGEEIGRVLRSFSNPDSLSHPSTYMDYNWDYSGNIHVNSTIMSHWFYLLSVGGSDTNTLGTQYSVTGIGIGKAAQIVRDAQNYYITSGTDYSNIRSYTISAASKKYGSGSNEHISVMNAWHAVGIGDRHPPIITGPIGGLCSGWLGTYSVTNVMPVYTWSCSSNLSINGSGSSVTVSATGGASSTGWVSVNSGGVELARLSVPVSTTAPSFISINGPTIVTPSGNSIIYESYFSSVGIPTYYEWSISGAPPSWYDVISGGSSSAYVYLYGDATYTVGIWACNGCGYDDGYINVEAYSNKKKSYNYYPNPVDDILTVEVDEQDTQKKSKSVKITYDIRLYDVFGTLRQQKTTQNSTVQFNMLDFPNGFYYLFIYNNLNNKYDTHKVIVQH